MGERMVEAAPEIEKEENNSENDVDNYLNKLLEIHEELGLKEKKSFTKEEQGLKHEIKSILYHEKKMDDLAMSDFLDVERCTVLHWRRKNRLPNLINKKERKSSKKKDYPKTEKELQVVREFVMRYIARSQARGAEGGNYSLGSAEEELVQKEV